MKKEYEEDFQSKKSQRAARKIVSRRDRSKFKKTDQEKREQQRQRVSLQRLKKKELLRGRVLAISPEGVTVESQESTYLCVLRGSLKLELTQAKNLVVVGDFVLFEPQRGEADKGSIVQVEERRSVLSRQEHLRRRQKQLIAANIDQVLITVSVAKPSLKPSLVDRYMIATYKGGMEPIILINKIDLLDETNRELYDLFLKTYRQLNIKIIPISIITGKGINKLKQAMKHRASVFSGQSGVGKSSIINKMTGLNLPIGEVVEKTEKGTHTTAASQLIPLAFGGWCIDTPGIRSFGIWDLQKEDLVHYFSEISALSEQCRYPNCTHSHEPGCALESALLKGEISPLRVDSYLKLLEEV